jgi:hypothetical protein
MALILVTVVKIQYGLASSAVQIRLSKTPLGWSSPSRLQWNGGIDDTSIVSEAAAVAAFLTNCDDPPAIGRRPQAIWLNEGPPKWLSLEHPFEEMATSFALPAHPHRQLQCLPVILTTPEEVDLWLAAVAPKALELQRLLPDALRIVASGKKEDRAPEAA